jgi:AhpD family alkylhydroperoxidase
VNRRLGDPSTDASSPEARELYRRFTTGERAAAGTDFSLRSGEGRLTGPPAAWLLAPRLGLALEPLGQAVRFGLSLPRRVHEIVILLVARAEDNDFERWAHTRAARAAGLTDEEITGLLDGSPVPLDDPSEASAFGLAAALLAGGAIDDDVFDDAVAVLGRAAVFEVVTLVGYYRMMALQLRAFDIRPPS